VKIPKTSIRTTWKADWLIEFSIALIALGVLTREPIFAAVGLAVSSTLMSLGIIFDRHLTVLRASLRVTQRLARSRVFMGDNVEGELSIWNRSRLAAKVKAVQPVVQETLSFEFSSHFDRMLLPGSEATFKFSVMPLARGRFRISNYQFTLTEARDLFAGELTLDTVGTGWIEVYAGVSGITEPLTPLALYGGGPERLRKSPSGADYAGIRQYTPGDGYNRIEWKATARLRALMVREFHPEEETKLQILIAAGKTMHRQSYVGTRLDEALAVAELLTESIATSKTPVGIWVYDETEVLKAMKPAMATEQVPRLRELSLALQTEKGAERREPPAPVSPPRALPFLRSPIPKGERVATFIRLLRLRLGLIHRRTGIYKALREATRVGGRGILVVLTDLETDTDAILDAMLTHQERGAKNAIAQMGAVWRLSDDLEQAYAEYQNNSRTLRRFERLDVAVFDLQPQRLIEAISHQIGKIIPLAPMHR